ASAAFSSLAQSDLTRQDAAGVSSPVTPHLPTSREMVTNGYCAQVQAGGRNASSTRSPETTPAPPNFAGVQGSKCCSDGSQPSSMKPSSVRSCTSGCFGSPAFTSGSSGAATGNAHVSRHDPIEQPAPTSTTLPCLSFEQYTTG